MNDIRTQAHAPANTSAYTSPALNPVPIPIAAGAGAPASASGNKFATSVGLGMGLGQGASGGSSANGMAGVVDFGPLVRLNHESDLKLNMNGYMNFDMNTNNASGGNLYATTG